MNAVNSVDRSEPWDGCCTGVWSFRLKTPPAGKSCRPPLEPQTGSGLPMVAPASRRRGPLEPMGQMSLHRRPLAIQNAVGAGVAQGAVPRDLMLPQYPVQFCAQSFDGGAALLIEEVCAEFHGDAIQPLEGVSQEQ